MAPYGDIPITFQWREDEPLFWPLRVVYHKKMTSSSEKDENIITFQFLPGILYKSPLVDLRMYVKIKRRIRNFQKLYEWMEEITVYEEDHCNGMQRTAWACCE